LCEVSIPECHTVKNAGFGHCMIISRHLITFGATAAANAATPPPSASDDQSTYKVTVTNITQSTVFTPLIGVAHNRDVSLFETAGEKTDTEATETCVPGTAIPVCATATAGKLLEAGNTTNFEITTPDSTHRFSMAGMLLPTNDAFVAVDSVNLPQQGSVTYYAKAYDAGSETNRHPYSKNRFNGDCTTDNQEKDGLFSSTAYDWKQPVAKVTITRQPHSHS